MLQAMRSSAKYIWLFIVAAFVLGFLLYETSGLFGRAQITPTTPIATVNGEDILVTQWQSLTSQMEEQQTQGSGRSISLDDRRRIEDQAYNELVDETLLSQEIRRRGIGVSDEEIKEAALSSPPAQLMYFPELQPNGQFDIEKFQRLLASPTARQSGLLSQLETYYRAQIPKQKLFEQIAIGAYPSDAELWAAYRDIHDTAQITFASARPTSIDPSITVSDDEIRTYYDTHKEEMEHPGRAMVSITQIRRTITPADSAAVKAHAIELRNRILAGEKFEDIAKSESADSGSALQGGDLGQTPKGRFVPDFEKAAYALKPGEISQPVLTQFGYHIIRLDSLKGDTIALHHILLRIAQSDSAASRTDRKADSLSKIAANAEAPARFDSAVKLLHLDISRAAVIEDEPAMLNGAPVPSVSAWAFGGARVGESSDLYEDDGGYYLARLESITPGGTPSLDAVKGDIKNLLIKKKQIDNLVGPARKLAQAAAASSFEQAAAVLHTDLGHSQPFTRVGEVPGVGRANEVIGAAFTLPLGAISQPIKTDEGVFVIRVDRRILADRKTFDAQKTMLRQQRQQAMQQARIRSFAANLRETAKITDNRKKVQAALSHTAAD
jgi:peptidyl-prolyl cis-trans isomerase D